MPPPRTNSVLTHEERRKVEEDLVAARERQPGRARTASPAKATATKAAPPKGTAKAAAPKPAPPKTVPAKLEKDRP
jgi:hypothetical protein